MPDYDSELQKIMEAVDRQGHDEEGSPEGSGHQLGDADKDVQGRDGQYGSPYESLQSAPL